MCFVVILVGVEVLHNVQSIGGIWGMACDFVAVTVVSQQRGPKLPLTLSLDSHERSFVTFGWLISIKYTRFVYFCGIFAT